MSNKLDIKEEKLQLKRWSLVRFNIAFKYIQGQLFNPNGNFFCYTLEPPWKDNQKNVSCIPEGIYRCKPIIHYTKSGKSYPAYEITNVKDRIDINIHIGNFPKDTNGCPLLGMDLLQGAVGDSAIAFNKFMAENLNKDFELEITNQIPKNIVPLEIKKNNSQIKIMPTIKAHLGSLSSGENNRVNFFDRIIAIIPRGIKRVTGVIAIVGGITAKIKDMDIGYILAVLGIIALIIGILHAIARKSKYGKKGEFGVSDLAQWLLDVLLKTKK